MYKEGSRAWIRGHANNVGKFQCFLVNNDKENGAYIKTWVGKLIPQSSYGSGGQPRGGGWGSVTNILFSNFLIHGAHIGASISENSGNDGSATGISLMELLNVVFENFTGYTQGGNGIGLRA